MADDVWEKLKKIATEQKTVTGGDVDDATRAAALKRGADALGVNPEDYATAISYESARTFDPWVKGPVTKWGQHRGTIQYGEPQRRKYGVHENQSFEEQVADSNVRYLKDAGVKPGMTFAQLYKAINAGNVNANENIQDANTGRTVGDNIRNAERDHREEVRKRFGSFWNAGASSAPAVENDAEKEKALLNLNRFFGDKKPPATTLEPTTGPSTQTVKQPQPQPNIQAPQTAAPPTQPESVERSTLYPQGEIDQLSTIAESAKRGELNPYDKYEQWRTQYGVADTQENRDYFNAENRVKSEYDQLLQREHALSANDAAIKKYNESVRAKKPAAGQKTGQAIPDAVELPAEWRQVSKLASPEEIGKSGAGTFRVDLRGVQGDRSRAAARAALYRLAPKVGASFDKIDQFLDRRGGNYFAQGKVDGDYADIEIPYSVLSDIAGPEAVKKAYLEDEAAQRMSLYTSDAPVAKDEWGNPMTRSEVAGAISVRAAEEQRARKQIEDAAIETGLNDDGSLSLTDTNNWKLAVGAMLTPEFWGSGRAEITEDQRQAVVRQGVDELIKTAGSARQAAAIAREYDQMSGLEKTLRHGYDFGSVIAKAPASFAKTIAWAEDSLGYLRENGVIIPTLTATDLMNGIGWLTAKTFGVEDKQFKQGEVPIFFAKAIEKAIPDDPKTANTIIGKLSRAAGSSVPFLVGAALTGGSTLAIATMGIGMQAGDMYSEAKDAGLSREKQLLSGLAGVPIGASEIFGLKWARLGQLIEQKSGGVFLKSFLHYITETGKEATEETLQEYFQSAAGSLTKAALTKNGLTRQDIADAAGGSLDDAGTGGFIGLLFGGGTPLAAHAAGVIEARGQERNLNEEIPETTIPSQPAPVAPNEVLPAAEAPAPPTQQRPAAVTQPVRKVPERPVTLDAQRDAMLDMEQPSAMGVLYTHGETPAKDKSSTILKVETDEGMLHVNSSKLKPYFEENVGKWNKDEAVQKIQSGEIPLTDIIGGKAVEMENTAGGTSVVTVDAEGNELNATKISDNAPENLTPEEQKLVAGQRKLDTERFGERATNTATVPTEEVANARKENRPIQFQGIQFRPAAEVHKELQEERGRRINAERAAEMDDLTGVANRKALNKALPSAEADANTSVIAFDANNFGKINKEVGQEEGDKALVDVASAIKQAAEESGVNRVFRRGGDEFVVLAPKAKADAIRARAEELYGEKKYGTTAVSISGTVGNTFTEADSTLQAAKTKRKAVVVDTPEFEPSGKSKVPRLNPQFPAKEQVAEKPKPLSNTQIEFSKEQAKPFEDFRRNVIDPADVADKSVLPEYAKDGIHEIEPHITVKYGLHTTNHEDVVPVLKGEKPIEIELGKTSVFKGSEKTIPGTDKPVPYDVVTVEVKSPDLKRLNKKITTGAENTTTFPYSPHVTLAYVKAGTGEKYAGKTDFEGQKYTFDGVTFSPADKSGKKVIPLGEKTAPKSEPSITKQFQNAINADAITPENIDQLRAKRKPVAKTTEEEGPLAKKATREGLTEAERMTFDEIEDLPFVLLEDLFGKATATRFGDRVQLNAQAHELVRRALEQVKVEKNRKRNIEERFEGQFLNPNEVREVIDVLRQKATEGKTHGYSSADVADLTNLAKTIDEAAKAGKGTANLYVFDRALPHELFHQADYLGAIAKTLLNRHSEAAKTTLDEHPVTEKAWKAHFSKFGTYTNTTGAMRKAQLRAEIPPYLLESSDEELGRVGITPEMRDDYLLRWFEGYVEKNGVAALEHFEKEELNVQRFIEEVRTANAGKEGVDNEQIRREDAEGLQPEGIQTGETRAGPQSRRGNEGPEVKLRSLPKTMRAAGLDAIDLAYEVFHDRDATAEAQRLLEKNGVEGSINLLRNLKAEAQDAQHAILSFMLIRTLIDHSEVIRQTDPETSKKHFDLALKLAEEHAVKATQAGRFTRIPSVIGTTVESFISAIKGVVDDVFEGDKTLSPEEWQKWEGMGHELEEVTAKATAISKELRNAKAKIKRLEDEKAGTKKTARRKNGKARKKLIDAIKQDYQANVDKVRERLHERFSITPAEPALKSVIDDEFPIDDFAEVGAMMLTEGLAGDTDYLPEDFKAEMMGEFGDMVEPHFDEIYKAAWERRNDWLAEIRADKKAEAVRKKQDEDLEDWEVDAIIGEQKEKARRRRAIEAMHRLAAKPKRVPRNLDAYKEIISDIAENDVEAIGAVLHAEGIGPNEMYSRLAEMDVKDDKARNAIRRGKDLFERAKKEFQIQQDKLANDLLDAHNELQTIGDMKWTARRERQKVQNAVGDELRRLKKGELAYRVSQIANALNAMRTMMASADMSADLRQGGFYMISSPENQGRALVDQFKSISEKGYGRVIMGIEAHNLFTLAQRSGVDFAMAGRTDEDHTLWGEELFRGEQAIEKIPLLGKIIAAGIVKPSERTYTSFLDTQRMIMFNVFAKELMDSGKSFPRNPSEFKKIAEFINIATGRGIAKNRLGRLLLNLPLFAPRYTLSRLQLLNMTLNPVAYYNMPVVARKIVAKKAVRFYGTTGAVMGAITLANLLGYAAVGLNWDDDDDDFLKITIGNTKYDIFAGTLQPAKVIIKLVHSALRTKAGFDNRVPFEFTNDVQNAVGRYVRGKLSPLASFGADVAIGEDYIGDKTELWGDKWYKPGKAIYSRFMPLTIADIQQSWKDDGVVGVAKSLPAAFFGVGVNTYKPRPGRPETAAEKLAAKMIASHITPKPKTAEEKKAMEFTKEITERFRVNDPQAETDLKAAVDAGTITKDDAKQIRKNGEKSLLEYQASKLGADELEKVLEVAEPNEKGPLKSILGLKQGRAEKKEALKNRPASEKVFRLGTDAAVDYYQENAPDMTEEQKKTMLDVIREKAKSASKKKTLTSDELKTVQEVIPDFTTKTNDKPRPVSRGLGRFKRRYGTLDVNP
jgi:diguanylate cyclase (GGDEF)-like protein